MGYIRALCRAMYVVTMYVYNIYIYLITQIQIPEWKCVFGGLFLMFRFGRLE